jgi:transposase
MASSGGRRRPQKYPVELRERAVRMVLEIREQTGEKHGAVTRVANELGVGAESLRGWVNRAEIDSGRRPGTSTADAQRIAQLERENRELRRANDILKAGGIVSLDRCRRRPGVSRRGGPGGRRARFPSRHSPTLDRVSGLPPTGVASGQ